MAKHAQLKEYDTKKQHVLRSLSYGGMIFEAGGASREVTEEQAAYLAEIRQRDTDPQSPKAFRFLAREYNPTAAKLAAQGGGDMRTEDLGEPARARQKAPKKMGRSAR